MEYDLWTYDTSLQDTTDLEGLDVEATDGSIGSIDEATYEVGSSYIVVDTGPWIFGKKVLIPASAIQKIDLDGRRVFLRLTKDQIKGSPEFDESSYTKPDYRDRVGTYYGPMF
ncbi:MAG TPA: PRC-barrel domain-containing protein [Actinomycetota bacterium]